MGWRWVGDEDGFVGVGEGDGFGEEIVWGGRWVGEWGRRFWLWRWVGGRR